MNDVRVLSNSIVLLARRAFEGSILHVVSCSNLVPLGPT